MKDIPIFVLEILVWEKALLRVFYREDFLPLIPLLLILLFILLLPDDSLPHHYHHHYPLHHSHSEDDPREDSLS